MNKATLAGKIIDIEFSNEFNGEKFYKAILEVARNSGNTDKIPCIIPDVLRNGLEVGCFTTFFGEIRTRSYYGDDEKKHLDVHMFVKDVAEFTVYLNTVELEGFICKEPIYRETPLGRQICDFFVAVNRRHGKSDYIPSISWGRDSLRVGMMKVGDKVSIHGRLQSREYEKKVNDFEYKTKTAYELSVSKVGRVEECKESE